VTGDAGKMDALSQFWADISAGKIKLTGSEKAKPVIAEVAN